MWPLFWRVLQILTNRGGSCTVALKEESSYVFDFCSSDGIKLPQMGLLTSRHVGHGIIFNLQEWLPKRNLYVRSELSSTTTQNYFAAFSWAFLVLPSCSDTSQLVFHMHLVLLKIVPRDINSGRKDWWICIRKIFLSSSSSKQSAIKHVS